MQVMRFGLLKKLKRGVRIKIFPSFICNLDCWYCANKFVGDGDYKRVPSMNYKKWIDIINEFPVKVKEVVISGGEPAIYKDLGRLVNYLTDNKIMVTIFSNLMIVNNEIKGSKRIRIGATHHIGTDETIFKVNLQHYIDKGIRVDVEEFKQDKKVDDSYTKFVHTKGNATGLICMYSPAFYFSPDGKLFPRKFEMMKYCIDYGRNIKKRPV